MINIQRNVIPAQPGWFVVAINEGMKATVHPVGAWLVVIDATASHDEPTVTCEPLVAHGSLGSGVLSAPAFDCSMAVFGPGQNPLPWAEEIEELGGERIAEWDVSDWMPSQAPVFATADEALWTSDSLPMDGMAAEG